MKRILYIVTALVMLGSCQFIGGLLHDDDVVARLGSHKLYRSELEGFLPKDVPEADSVKLAAQYINAWALEQLFQDVAEKQLSKMELDVTSELEDYRRSLLKYRYEQRFVNERLDTMVAREQIEQYYEGHKDLFILQRPIVKARFLDIMKESPNLDLLRTKMSSSRYEDLAQVDSIAYSSALKYEDHSDEWQDAAVFARNFALDYGTLLSRVKPDGYVQTEDEKGDVKIGYIVAQMRAGALAPLEYCEPRIKDIIINARKHELLVTLEQDLLNDALEHKQLIIYDE